MIFDGDGAYRLIDIMAGDYHYFEDLTIRNTDIAFYAGLKRVMGSSGLTVKHCKIEDVGIAVLTYSADSKDFYIADNTIIGISVFSNGRNNLFIGPDDDRPTLSATILTVYSTLDYNGYRKKGGSSMKYRLRYPTTMAQNHADEKELSFFEFKTLNEFRKKTGFEMHGVELGNDIFENVPLPDPNVRGTFIL